MSVTLSTEIRHLPADVIQTLAALLDPLDYWRLIAERIVVSPSDPSPLYTAQHLFAIKRSPDGPTLTLLNDWGTHGRNGLRPTLQSLIEILTKCHLEKVAYYLSVDVLNGEPPSNGITISTSTEFRLLNSPSSLPRDRQRSENDPHERSSSPPIYQESISSLSVGSIRANGVYRGPPVSDLSLRSEILEDDKFSTLNEDVSHLSLSYLIEITNGFDDRKLSAGGRKLGAGAFSQVFLGKHDEEEVAVKRINREFSKEFLNEVYLLSSFPHENLLKLLAVCSSDSYLCIVVEYMANGSLQDRLNCLDNSSPIPWQRRLTIASDITKGVAFLHSHDYIHRDLKSANILLDTHWTAKLGDFGIAHEGPNLIGDTSLETKQPAGTSVYMPKEAFIGIISDKLDSYSFGVVLLELLTGMKPFQPDVHDDLVTIVKHECSDDDDRIGRIDSMLDKFAGNWNLVIANQVFAIAWSCLKEMRNNRPSIADISPQFLQFVNEAT